MNAAQIYFVCTRCDDKFLMDEDYVEVRAEGATGGKTRRVGLEYTGRDCLCPICETFNGQLVRID